MDTAQNEQDENARPALKKKVKSMKKCVYSKRQVWISDSEEKELIIIFFIVKYSSVQEGFLLVLLNGYSKGK